METSKKQLKDIVANVRDKYKTAKTSEAFLVAKVLEEYGFYLDPYKVRLLQHIEKNEVKLSSIIRTNQKIVAKENLKNINDLYNETIEPRFIPAPVFIKESRSFLQKLFGRK